MSGYATQQDLLNGAKDLQTVAAVATSLNQTVTDRLGNTKLTLTGAFSKLGFFAPVAYTSGVLVTTSSYTVTNAGNTYFANPDSLPYTTSLSFDPLKWKMFNEEFAGAEMGRIANYTLLRAYAGAADVVTITNFGIAGQFNKTNRVGAVDNGGTVIIASNGDVWERDYWGAMNVAWFGIVGDNTTDWTTRIQVVLDLMPAELFFPAGTYIVRGVDIKSSIRIFGAGWKTKLRHPIGFNGRVTTSSPTYPYDVDGMFNVNGGGLAGTPNIADNMQDIHISDMWIHGTSVEDGFLETLNLIVIISASNVSITDCKFTAFRGDAIDFPTGSILHGNNERHVTNVYIARNYFDGVNFQNRQAISVYSAIGVTIEDNWFTRTTVPAMPGAIDLEPGGSINPYMLNVTIRNNRFFNIGATNKKPAIATLFSEITDISRYGNIVIESNLFDTCQGLQLYGTPFSNDPLINNLITIKDNKFSEIERGILISNIWGITVIDNAFDGSDAAMQFGNTGIIGNIRLEGNSFNQCARVDGLMFLLYAVNGLSVKNNKFTDCGKLDGSVGSLFYSVGGQPVTKLELLGNEIWDNNNRTIDVVANADGAIDIPSTKFAENTLKGSVVFGLPQAKSISGTTSALNNVATSLFTLENGTYQVSAIVSGDAVNYGVSATVIVGASTTRLIASNAPLLTLTVNAGALQGTQGSGGTNNISWTYRKTQR